MSPHIDTECDDGLFTNTRFLNYHHPTAKKCQFHTTTLEVFKYNKYVWNSEENPKGVCGKLPDEIQKMAGWLFLSSLSPNVFLLLKHQQFVIYFGYNRFLADSIQETNFTKQNFQFFCSCNFKFNTKYIFGQSNVKMEVIT